MTGKPNGDRTKDPVVIRKWMTEAIKRSGKSREQLADEMTALTGQHITARMISSFTAESKELHRWPAEFYIAFCQIVDDFTILSNLVEMAGFRMIGPEEDRLIQIGRAFLQKIEAEKILAEAGL